MNDARQERLAADYQQLQELADKSPIFSFESKGSPPDNYVLLFRGRGLNLDSTWDSEVEHVDLHRIEMRLPFSYPNRPPDLSWKTAIYHPNVSFGGGVTMRDMGLTWDNAIPLRVIVERLWDIARFDFINSEVTSNYAARNWLERQENLTLPADPRPLLKDAVAGVYRYHWRMDETTGGSKSPAGAETIVPQSGSGSIPTTPEEQGRPPRQRPAPRIRTRDAGDTIFIGEDAPMPPDPPPPRPRYRPRRRPDFDVDDDDVLFIE